MEQLSLEFDVPPENEENTPDIQQLEEYDEMMFIKELEDQAISLINRVINTFEIKKANQILGNLHSIFIANLLDIDSSIQEQFTERGKKLHEKD